MQPLPAAFMALLLAHLLGDFPLQSRWIVSNKGQRLMPLLLHGAAHYVLAWACLIFLGQVRFLSIRSQAAIAGYLLLHLLIDRVKARLIARGAVSDNCGTFLADQGLHAVALVIAALLLTRSHIFSLVEAMRLSASARTRIVETAIIYAGIVFGGGYLIRHLTMAMQSPALVGLILTGKSIARFPEFKEARFAEYFLIGTLLSFLLSILGGIVLLYLLYGTISLK